ncbi:peptide methionine sulfoxide reductase MsrB [Betaproteobacteria bacterium]|nr:peptide methionine sulfoxide reductase MsrB [Betaproteobacteria bacterium]
MAEPAEPANPTKTAAQWREQLTDEQYHVTRERGTERPFSGQYHDFWQAGAYHCVCCGAPLFQSGHKFDAGCGWPSFSHGDDARLETLDDFSHGMRRTEVRCQQCGAHLGHLFPDGPPQRGGQRYCINSAALAFQPEFQNKTDDKD